MDACCPEAQGFEAEAESCSQAAAACDATLEACCRRDLEQQALVARLKAQLSIHDRSKERLRAAGRVLGGVPPPPAAAPGSDLETDEEDEQLGRLQAQRLQQLQRGAQRKARLQREGHGDVAAVPEVRLLREAEACRAPLVCHLAFEGSPLNDELDEHLAGLAHRYLGTRFVRTPITLRSTLHLRLRTAPGPGLLCFRGGNLVGAAPLDRFGAPECIAEEEVDKWLRQRGMLHLLRGDDADGARPAAAGSGDEGGSGSSEEGQEPCEVCGRRYPHQHIRSVMASRASGSDSD